MQGGRYAMGTVLEATLHGRDRAALERSRDRLFGIAESLDALLSTYVADSDVSLLNAAAGKGPQRLGPEAARVLRLSADYAARTGGAFDVTVGPLVTLWIEAAARDRLPSDAEIAAARARVGSDRLRFGDDGEVELLEGSSVNLGAIAKGYALDRMAEALREEGTSTAALLSFGQSSVWAIGRPPDAPGWRLLARSPDGGFAGVLTLRDLALSVSGSLGQWSEIGGRRFGHVIDPRSGWPLTRRREALVVGPSGALTEALSTALLVLGPEAGIARVEAEPGCEGLLLEPGGARHATSGFDALTAFEPIPEAPQGPAAGVRTGRDAEGSLLSGL